MSKNELLKKCEAKRTKCEVYTRVMGYHRPVQSYNVGKRGEFNERLFFSEKKTCCCCA